MKNNSERKKAVFLDRDGVLNHALIKNGKPYPPANLKELTIPNDAKTALNMLKSHGFLLIGATNQPDVARGTTPREIVEMINRQIMSFLPLDDIRVCYHDNPDNCECRKPLAGLLIQAADDYDIDLAQSIMVGDRWKDIEAGKNAGCKTIWLRCNYNEPEPPRAPDFIASSLSQAAEWVISC
ncbi:MAG: HAD family hydrolase [Gammaproteobacteria bacterium]|nr:HAD family hydrolase [Gammaproteobacteria bacterium]